MISTLYTAQQGNGASFRTITRASPGVTLYDPTTGIANVAYHVTQGGVGTTNQAINIQSTGESGFVPAFNISKTAGDGMYYHYVADAEV